MQSVKPRPEPVHVGIVHDPKGRKEWAATRDRCYLCGRRDGWDRTLGVRVWIEVHHVIGGLQGRSDEPCNLAAVDRVCHRRFHDGEISLMDVLKAKKRIDPDEWDFGRLCVLAGKNLDPDGVLT